MVDEMWVEDIWGGQSYGFAQLPAIGNSGGIKLVWDTRIFECKEAVGDDRFIAVKGSWKGKNQDVFLVCIYGPHDMELEFGPKPFRIFNLWMEEPDFYKMVEEVWGKEVRSTRPDCIFRDRLKNIKASLRVWSKEKFGGHREKIESLKNEAMKWELEAEKRVLTESERSSWLGARKQWEVKDREYGNMLRQKDRIKSASMSILVNGSPSEEFGLERGVRQGDPLSSFLFILAAEGLNAIVSEAVEQGIFRGVVVGENKVMVSHLQYTDDTIFFGEWNKENAKSLMCILKCFEEVSGLRVNYNKSKLYGIGVNETKMSDMARWMGYGIGEFPFTYLGLPIGENMRRVSAWGRVIGGKMVVCGIRGRGIITYGVGNGSGLGALGVEWTLGGDREFAVKELARVIEENVLRVENGGHETLWNNLVPKKVNVFVWRALRGRIPVRVELDKRDMDLDSVLCPCCNEIVESCAHSLVTCDLAMSVWIKVFNWWKVGGVNSFTIEEVFSHGGGVNVPISLSRVWQAVI
ncbi:reverse transcriptase domain, reverse transcriptase zinc-binding domain protein [Tanacetum coccineum]